MDPAAPKLRARARIAFLGPLGFVVAAVAMHFLRSDLDPATHRVSEYALEEWGLVQTLGFFSWAAGGFALAACVRAVPGARRPAALLAVFGFAMVAVALFPADPVAQVGDTPVGEIHSAAAFVAFVALVVGMAMLARPLVQARGRLRLLGGFTELMSVVAVPLVVVQTVVPDDGAGIWQRLLLGTTAAWMLVAGWTYVRLSASRTQGGSCR